MSGPLDKPAKAESGPAGSGPPEPGPAESGPPESGPAESGPSESGPPDLEADATVAGPAQAEPATGVRAWLVRQGADTRPLAVAPFRRLALGQATAFIGSMLTQTAVPVQVYSLTNSSLLVGLVGFAGLVPIVLFGLYGGAIADAVDRRKLYLLSSLGTWAVTLLLLLQSLLHANSVLLILGLVVVQSGAFAVASAARGAIIPRIVPTGLIPAANTLSFTLGNIGQVIGPLIAGVLLALSGSKGFDYAYGVDAVLFTAALYSAFRLPPVAPDGTLDKPGLRSVVDGLKFIVTRPVLLMSFAVDICAMVLAMPRALFPAAAADKFGTGSVGWLYAAIALGALVAGASSGWIGRVRRQGRALVFAIVGWGIAVAAAGLVGQLWLCVLLLGVGGAADLVSAVYRQTILQTYAPDQMRGRMQGVFIAVVAGGPRLGDLRAGVSADVVGTTAAWVGGGLVCSAVVAVLGLSVRSFWRYTADDAREAAATPV